MNKDAMSPFSRLAGWGSEWRMRARRLGRASSVILLLCVAWPVCVFADAADAGDGMLPSADMPVSAEEIAEGIAFCDEFPVSLVLDGVPVESDTPPVIIRERTLIPARALFERMNAVVLWNEETRQVSVSTTGAGVILTIDAFEYTIDGNTYVADVPPLIISERTMIPVRVVAESVGCNIEWNDLTRTVTVSSRVSEIPYENAANYAAGDSGEMFGTDTVSRGGIPARDGMYSTLPQLNPKFTGFSVVIDAGHGGMDSGALGEENGQTLLFEKDINLDVALRLNEYLSRAGFYVRMIRSGDVTVDIYDRPQIANSLGAELFISIHNNSSKKPDVSGTSTYYYNKEWAAGYTLDSETLAASVQKAVSAYTGLPDMGIHDGPEYIVLNRTQMPAIIVEGAFLSNASDRALMMTDAYREAYAFGVAAGLINALNGREHSGNPPLDAMMPIGL